MAEIPLPIGIGKVLVDIARGLGEAAQALPTSSRSFVGAVAMRTARMRIDFELATATSERDSGLGIRTNQTVGLGLVDNATVTRGASTGFIEFEVVAVADAGEAAPEEVPDRRAGRARMRSAQPDPVAAATPAAREGGAGTGTVPSAGHPAKVVTGLTASPGLVASLQDVAPQAPVEEAGAEGESGARRKSVIERRKSGAEAKDPAGRKGRASGARTPGRGKGD